MRTILFSLALLGLVSCESRAGWGPGGCPPTGRSVHFPSSPFIHSSQTVVTAPSYHWVKGPTDPSQIHLYDGNRQVGSYSYHDSLYYPFNGSDWGKPTVPPVTPPRAVEKADCCGCDCPKCGTGCQCRKTAIHCGDRLCRCVVQPEVVQNFGVDLDKLEDVTTPRFTLNGQEVTQERALDSITAPTIPSDGSKLRLTVIGPQDACNRVLHDLTTDPQLASVRDKFAVQFYRPDQWPTKEMVTDFGFQTAGVPTIYVQTPEGKVLHRQDTYSGPDQLFAALRNAHPEYNKDKDPDLSKTLPIPNPLDWLKKLFPSFSITTEQVVLLICGLVGLFLLTRKEK